MTTVDLAVAVFDTLMERRLSSSAMPLCGLANQGPEPQLKMPELGNDTLGSLPTSLSSTVLSSELKLA